MEKICLIYQPCGLGDIFFLQKICKLYIEKGYRIIYPVVYEYEWLNDYIDGIEFISFVCFNISSFIVKTKEKK
jgi:hypothetical protein